MNHTSIDIGMKQFCIRSVRPSVRSPTRVILIFILIWVTYLIIFMENPEVLKAWNCTALRNTSIYIQPDKETVMLMPNDFCSTKIHLLVIVYTRPSDYVNRQLIRRTLVPQKQVSGYMIEYYFLLGKANNLLLQEQINTEYRTYNDILQENFIENYYNLTLKTMFMFKNVKRRCLENTKFVLKVDCDVYVNIPNLVAMLKLSKHNHLLLGHLHHTVFPKRSGFSKWYTPYCLYNGNIYPSYISGPAYVMSIDIIPKLYNASLVRPIFHLEDVYLGMLAQDIGLQLTHSPLFDIYKTIFTPCKLVDLITSHSYSTTQLSDIYASIPELNRTCN